MLLKQLSILAFVAQTLAQNTPTLAEALSSSPDLSTLGSVLQLNKNLVDALSSAKNITILAPSNAAFAKLGNATLDALAKDTPLLTAILQYHVLNGSVESKAITSKSAFVPSLLTDHPYTSVSGGQRVKAQLVGDKVVFTSGLQDSSTVVKADVKFTGGVIHVIDTVLTVPESASDTLSAAGLTSLRGALLAANLVTTVEDLSNVTIFAPSNAAFQAIGSGLGSLTTEQVTSILTYHVVVAAAPGYSSGLSNGAKLKTVNGGEVTVSINGGGIFVNGARVVTPDVLVANGVVHVIDQVLNPNNTAGPSPSATAGAPAYSGASSVSNAPFTSGQPQPSRSIGAAPTASGAPASANTSGGAASSPTGPPQVSTAGAAPALQSGAVGMGAILGAAAIYFL